MDAIKKQMRELFPGREVEFETAKGTLKAVVYPVGFRHLAEFGEKIAKVKDEVVRALVASNDSGMSALVNLGMSGDAALMASAAPLVIPIIIKELSELVEDCTAWPIEGMTLAEVPHDVATKVVGAWVAESFGQKKSEAWVELAKGLGGLLPANLRTAAASVASESETQSKS